MEGERYVGGVTSLSDFYSPKLERSLDVGGCGDDLAGGGRRVRGFFSSWAFVSSFVYWPFF